MDKSNASTKEDTSTSEALYKNKLVIKGITLILNEIIEENYNQEKKRQAQDKRGSNIRTSVKGKFRLKNERIADGKLIHSEKGPRNNN